MRRVSIVILLTSLWSRNSVLAMFLLRLADNAPCVIVFDTILFLVLILRWTSRIFGVALFTIPKNGG